MSKRRLALFVGFAVAVPVFALVLGFATPAAAAMGVPTFLVGVVSCALFGAGLGAVLHVLATRRGAPDDAAGIDFGKPSDNSLPAPRSTESTNG
ncbi:hypothetical protein [Nocardia blacklockiae]|uniref:hypothetical protein n=1 Tax=Nocardia blacklockiae TaxID=480036 RepID=UPI00189626A4|nr:hypothetical protein [Nocardia blacklockiae]MBF6172198.1 hypothetical protein [Nocardia blacklockiae]